MVQNHNPWFIPILPLPPKDTLHIPWFDIHELLSSPLLSSLSSSKSKNSERFEASPVSFCNLKIQYKHKNNLIVSFCNLKSAWNVSTNSSSKHSDLKISMVSQTTNLTSADLLHWLSLFLISYLSLWFEKSTHLLSSLGSGGSYNLCCFWDRRRQR